MFKKKTALNVRPQPPSFAEMTEDINSADSNDIIFTQIKSGMMMTCSQCYCHMRRLTNSYRGSIYVKTPKIQRPKASGVENGCRACPRFCEAQGGGCLRTLLPYVPSSFLSPFLPFPSLPFPFPPFPLEVGPLKCR